MYSSGTTGPSKGVMLAQGYYSALALAHIDFGPMYERAQGQPEYGPAEILPDDTLISRGTGRYHADKRREQ